VILPAPALSGERAAARLRDAEAILAEAGFHGAVAENHAETLLVRLGSSSHLVRLQDDAFREALVARLSALGFPYVAVDLVFDSIEDSSSSAAG
jgi:hypothetical protein